MTDEAIHPVEMVRQSIKLYLEARNPLAHENCTDDTCALNPEPAIATLAQGIDALGYGHFLFTLECMAASAFHNLIVDRHENGKPTRVDMRMRLNEHDGHLAQIALEHVQTIMRGDVPPAHDYNRYSALYLVDDVESYQLMDAVLELMVTLTFTPQDLVISNDPDDVAEAERLVGPDKRVGVIRVNKKDEL